MPRCDLVILPTNPWISRHWRPGGPADRKGEGGPGDYGKCQVAAAGGTGDIFFEIKSSLLDQRMVFWSNPFELWTFEILAVASIPVHQRCGRESCTRLRREWKPLRLGTVSELRPDCPKLESPQTCTCRHVHWIGVAKIGCQCIKFSWQSTSFRRFNGQISWNFFF